MKTQKHVNCSIVERKYVILSYLICLNHSLRYKHNKLEKCHEKPRHKKAVFQNLDNFHI